MCLPLSYNFTQPKALGVKLQSFPFKGGIVESSCKGEISLKNSSYVTANTICSPTRLFTKRFPLPDSIREYVLRLSGDPKVCNWQLSLPESVHTEAVFF